MLLDVIRSEGSIPEKLLLLLISVLVLLPALTFHEWAHGFAAYKLGDSTAKADGRLSLNPLRHFDPIGTLMLLLVGFGWAKPVPVITRNFKKPRRDFAICSLAGPIANFVLAFLSAFLCVLWDVVCFKLGVGETTNTIIETALYYSIVYNVGLGLFNLIPIPPLDGSNVLICLLPNRAAAKYSRIRLYSHYIIIAIVILSWLPYPLNRIEEIIFMPLTWARNGLVQLFVITFVKLFSLFL